MITADGFRNSRGERAEALEIFKLEAKGLNVVGDECWKKTECAVPGKARNSTLEFLGGKAWILKIHPGKSIYLNIKKALHIREAEDLSRKHQQAGCVCKIEEG